MGVEDAGRKEELERKVLKGARRKDEKREEKKRRMIERREKYN